MNNITKHMQDLLNEFIIDTPDELAIFGAGYWGNSCYEWLSSYELEKNVCFFIDSDVNKQGKILNGKSIFSIQILDNKPNLPVVICQCYDEIFRIMQSMNYKNPVYIFIKALNDPSAQLSHQDQVYMTDQLYNIYNTNDKNTKNVIDLFMHLGNTSYGAIIPYTSMPNEVAYINYWGSSELDLSCFNELTMIDGGAFTGDTIEYLYSEYQKHLAKIYAFEPDIRNYKMLLSYLEKRKLNRLTDVYCAGLSDKNQKLFLDDNAEGRCANLVENGSIEVQTLALDTIDLAVNGKLCIKMDIEGFEMKALLGAAETICLYKPELAICVYHRPTDILEIPAYIKMLVPDYKFILRCGTHLECYASVERY